MVGDDAPAAEAPPAKKAPAAKKEPVAAAADGDAPAKKAPVKKAPAKKAPPKAAPFRHAVPRQEAPQTARVSRPESAGARGEMTALSLQGIRRRALRIEEEGRETAPVWPPLGYLPRRCAMPKTQEAGGAARATTDKAGVPWPILVKRKVAANEGVDAEAWPPLSAEIL